MVGTAFANALAVTVTANDPLEPVAGGVITFSAPASGASAGLSASRPPSDRTAWPRSPPRPTASPAATRSRHGERRRRRPRASPDQQRRAPPDQRDQRSLRQGSAGFVYNRTTRQFTQTLTITNISGAAITGPIELVLLNLKNATLVNQSGTYQGNPYITILSSGSLGVGQSLTITLVFTDPTLATITYTPEFLVGPIPSDD